MTTVNKPEIRFKLRSVLARTSTVKLLYPSPKLCRFFAISRESGRCLA